METSIVDLPYNIKEVLEALERREKVIITYHGKPRGILLPLPEKSTGGKVTEQARTICSTKHIDQTVLRESLFNQTHWPNCVLRESRG